MGLRFRKSFKIAPGVRWNLGLRGSSLSVGGRGATLNLSKRGGRATVGIPGTGLSYSQRLKAPSDTGPGVYWKWGVGIVSAILLFRWPLLGLIGLAATLLIPSRKAQGGGESSSVGEAEMPLPLGGDSTVAPIVGHSNASLELDGGDPELVPIIGAEGVLGSQPCYFRNPVFLEREQEGEQGIVYLGATELVFIGVSEIAFPWTAVSAIACEDGFVAVHRRDRKTPYCFFFDDNVSAVRAARVAERLRSR
jgi:hypothetical protein